MVSPLLRAEVVGECLARCTPRGLQKIQWSGHKGSSDQSFEGEEIKYSLVLKTSNSFENNFTLTNDHAN